MGGWTLWTFLSQDHETLSSLMVLPECRITGNADDAAPEKTCLQTYGAKHYQVDWDQTCCTGLNPHLAPNVTDKATRSAFCHRVGDELTRKTQYVVVAPYNPLKSNEQRICCDLLKR
eukprot:Nk52_evm13s2612 gene=Nk52_evmTU13s2612